MPIAFLMMYSNVFKNFRKTVAYENVLGFLSSEGRAWREVLVKGVVVVAVRGDC